jgi:alpha-aminoadipate/glutamate carrier protein LysW
MAPSRRFPLCGTSCGRPFWGGGFEVTTPSEGTSVSVQAKCLVCDSPIEIPSGTLASELVRCGSCGQEHEVVQAGDEPMLALAPEVEEDWGE